MARARSSERGAALLVVMVAVAVLTALAVDLAYDARVSLRISANARDELRATYLAKSGVNLSRLVLSFQQRIDGISQGVAALQGAGGAQGGAGLAAMPRPQIWRLVPVGSDLAASLFGDEGAAVAARPAREAPPPTVAPAARYTGEAPAAARPAPPREGFDADIDDEGQKVNAQLDGTSSGLGGGVLTAQVQALYQLICDPKWDPLFDREDANGMRVSRQELLVYLHDWIQKDDGSAALAASFPPGGCTIEVPPNPFEPSGGADKNAPYQRGKERYRAKNSYMDSLDELYMVAGIGDAFMGAFGDDLTVYLPRSAARNVNTTVPSLIVANARGMATSQAQNMLSDQAIADSLVKEMLVATADGLLAITPAQFGAMVRALGIPVDGNKLGGPNSGFTDRSTVFRIRASGRAGAVEKALDAVVMLDTQQQTAQIQGQNASPTPGRIIHWREE